MQIKTTYRRGIKHILISGVCRGDFMLVVPYLVLQGMDEKDAADGYREAVNGEFTYHNSKRNVMVTCSR